MNKTHEQQVFKLSVPAETPFVLSAPNGASTDKFTVGPDRVDEFRLFVSTKDTHAPEHFYFTITNTKDGKAYVRGTSFSGIDERE